MIKAGIVGLGWWGKTLVESGENSDAIRFVAGTTRTVTPEVEAPPKVVNLMDALRRSLDTISASKKKTPLPAASRMTPKKRARA